MQPFVLYKQSCVTGVHTGVPIESLLINNGTPHKGQSNTVHSRKTRFWDAVNVSGVDVL